LVFPAVELTSLLALFEIAREGENRRKSLFFGVATLCFLPAVNYDIKVYIVLIYDPMATRTTPQKAAKCGHDFSVALFEMEESATRPCRFEPLLPPVLPIAVPPAS